MSSKRDNIFYQARAILSRRDHSEAELRRKLARAGFSTAAIAEAIEQLQQQRLLNDESLARLYVDSVLRQRAVGPRWLQQKLRARGVAGEIVTRVLNEVMSGEGERRLMARAVEQWQRTHRESALERQRLGAWLQRRGFTYGSITAYLAAERDVGE